MTATYAPGLSESHNERLRWFEDRRGTTTGWPKRMPDGSFLATTAKGIFKPEPPENPYALSVKMMLKSKYRNGPVTTRDDGSYFFLYHQEGPLPIDRDKDYTNRALMRCIEDQVPVGVLRQRPVPKASDPVCYDILGLATPVGWVDGYFVLAGHGLDGQRWLAETLDDALLGTAARDAEQDAPLADPGGELPTDDADDRRRINRAIAARLGGPAFRARLKVAYGGRCAVTGSDVWEAVEAAHLLPYRGPDFNTVTNGLPLRGDVHTLLDLWWLGIDPTSRTVVLAAALTGTQYEVLRGQPLTEPTNPADRPSDSVLARVYDKFLAAERSRGSRQPSASASRE